jgi:hypothetical protein
VHPRIKPFYLCRRISVVVLSLLCMSCFAISQSVQGDWSGTLNGNLPLVFHLDGSGGGTVDSPTQNFTGQLQYSTTGNQITITVAQVGGTYAGTVNGNQMNGTWSQNGQKASLALTKGGNTTQGGTASNGGASTVQGDWSGTLNGNLPLVFHLDGSGGGTVDSPAQHFTGQLQYSTTGNQITITVAQVGGTYSGAVNGNQMKGTWSQNGQSLPLVLTKH